MSSEPTLKITEPFCKPIYVGAVDSQRGAIREVELYAWKGEQGKPVFVGTHYPALTNVKSLGFSNGFAQLAEYLENAAKEGYVPQIYSPPRHAGKKALQASARGEFQARFRPLSLDDVLALRRAQNRSELNIAA